MVQEKKNPFPRKGVISLGGATEQRLRTLPTKQFVQAAQLTTNYLNDGIGQVITISGSYGSGKTHVIYYAMDAVRKTAAETNDASRFVQVYAKTENPEFVSLYQQLVRQIGYPLLREVNVRFLGIIALKELAKEEEKTKKALLDLIPEERKEEIQEAAYEKSKQQAIERFRTNPEIVFKYLDNLIIQPEVVLDRRASDLEEIAGENFKKAFFYLDDVDIGKIAYKWFVMEELSDTDLRQLGVSSPLNTADEAKHALRLLATLFQYAEIRLLVYIDQVERFLIGTDQKISEENAGQLHSLAEFFPRENAFLALSGSEEGWRTMTPDFWSRIGPTQILMEQITPEQSRDFIKIYLQEDETYSPYQEPSEVAPFSPDAIDEILRLRGGNIRHFLQICYHAYEMYLRENRSTIDPDLVRQVVKDVREFFDRQTVYDEIRSILRKKNLRFESEVNLMKSFKPDFVIGEVSNPSAVIEISDSLFYMDEAKKALDIVNFREGLVKKYPRTRLIVIAMGYVSSEVLNHLKGVVDNCIVYEGQNFGERFEAVIDSVVSEEKKSIPVEVDQKLKHGFVESVKDSLQELLTERQEEIGKLNARLDMLLRAQTEERRSSETLLRKQEWRNWLRQDQERWEHRQTELKQKADDERRGLQEEGERLRLREALIKATPYILVSIGTALGTFVFLTAAISFEYYRGSIIFELRGLFSLGIGFLMAVQFYHLIVHRRLFPLGSLTNEVARFSGDLGHLALRAKTASISPYRIYRCLENPNPIIRYFAAQFFLVNKKDEYDLPSINWGRKATSETWIPLYLLYLKLATITEEPEALIEYLKLLLEANPDDPRIIHAISMLAKSQRAEGLNVEKQASYVSNSRYGKVSAHAIFENVIDPHFFWSSKYESHPLVEFAVTYMGSPGRMSTLVERFRERGRFWNDETEEPITLDVTEDELRLIVNTLSPHREEGLASFQELAISNLYLRLYRFFAEIEWHMDRGNVVLAAG